MTVISSETIPRTQETLKLIGLEKGICLTPNRIAELDKNGMDYWAHTMSAESDYSIPGGSNRLECSSFFDNGLTISLPLDREKDPVTTSSVDFIPRANGESWQTRNLKHATRFMYCGLLAMQNFCLLVEAGYIREPELMSGVTNKAMARIANRIGFSILESKNGLQLVDFFDNPAYKVEATFKDVDDKVLSPEAQRHVDLLRRRLAKQSKYGAYQDSRSLVS